MENNLKSLDEHNKERLDHFIHLNNLPKPNGIGCPQCGAELLDSTPYITLTSNPPKKDVHCAKCDYRGYRIA